MNDKVIYFSLKKSRADSFYDYIVKKGICYRPKFSFNLIKPDVEFEDPRDLLPLIEKEPKKDSLHIIIDYISCCEWDKVDDHATVLRDIIMAYPEVQFLFDETFVRNSCKKADEGLSQIAVEDSNPDEQEKDGKEEDDQDDDFQLDDWCFLHFLFQDASIVTDNNKLEGIITIDIYLENGRKMQQRFSVLANWHQFDLGNGNFEEKNVKEQFIRLLKGRNNMYDASNLRCAIKAYKFSKLHVKNNFSKLADSRRDNVSVAVDEEHHQVLFNGYCLYANGFRVFPIMTASELRWYNMNTGSRSTVLVRDLDLQFLDEHETESELNRGNKNEVDFIRAAKKTNDKKRWEKLLLKDDTDKSNVYWKKFIVSTTGSESSIESFKGYFVSKGEEGVVFSKELDNSNDGMKITQNGLLVLKGIKKPIEGIYYSIQKLKEVQERYIATIQEDKIDLVRKGEDGHSCPLDVYGIARSMVKRAELYYKNDRPRLAALVAGEAIEVLNGFHLSLMKQAYYLQAVSENAIAMSLLGGEESVLCDDLIMRMGKVKQDVERIVIDKEDRLNLLMNIYNDCRLFCREKEYLEAADYVLSFMMHEKEGIRLPSIKRLKKCFHKCDSDK